MLLFQLITTEQSIGQPKALDQCLAQMRAGNKNALAQLYTETKTAVYGFALSILKNTADAEDVLQETYINLWGACDTYVSQGKPMAFILTIARNLSMQKYRDYGKLVDIPEEDWVSIYADNQTLTSEDRMVIQSAMETLAEDERQIVVLHATGGLKHKEIAVLLHMPLATVLSKYHRAKQKLRNLLKEEDLYEKNR